MRIEESFLCRVLLGRLLFELLFLLLRGLPHCPGVIDWNLLAKRILVLDLLVVLLQVFGSRSMHLLFLERALRCRSQLEMILLEVVVHLLLHFLFVFLHELLVLGNRFLRLGYSSFHLKASLLDI